MTTQANQIKFVICERLHEGGSPVPNILKAYEADTFWFADGDPDCFNPDEILKFDSYDSAKVIVDLAWNLNQTYLGIAIWESCLPNEIDYTYVNWGKDKNLQVKHNRESGYTNVIF